jgi:putative GTP pyrophosphokinase
VTSTSKTQIDLLGDRLKRGKVSDDDLVLLVDYRASFVEAYEEVVAAVRASTQLEPTGRPAKSTTSIIEKLRRETIRLSQMQDIAGCRLVVEDIAAQDRVVERLKATFAKVVIADRRKEPSYGYRAVHVIVTARSRFVEIQIRTELQHLWAQVSERLSDVFGPAIKYGGSDRKAQDLLSRIAKRIEDYEKPEAMESQALTVRHHPDPDYIKQDIKRDLRERLRKSLALIPDFKAEKEDEDALSNSI